MPRYDFECCKKWEQYVDYDNRNSVRCVDCGKLANRLVSLFAFNGATYVGTDRFKGAEIGTGVKGLESVKDVDRALAVAGAQPIDAYYRPPKPPPPKEVTLKELAPYLDGMPLDNTNV